MSGIPPGFPFLVIPDISHAPGELTNSNPRHSPGTFARTRTLTTSLAPGRYLVARVHPARLLRTRAYTPHVLRFVVVLEIGFIFTPFNY